MWKQSHSLLAFWICAILLISANVLYPRYKQINAEATIGWDVSGYYAYLPAVFIYGDLKKAAFLDEMRVKYGFTPSPMQGFVHTNGNFVFKYSSGQALQFLPWFLLGHIGANLSDYPADGFSFPYQMSITFGSLLVALIGLWFCRKVLLKYFSERTTAITLICIAIGTNYLNYATIDGAMTHNWLFTCITLIMWNTILFYENPNTLRAAAIGFLCGFAILTRPTEIIIAMIPLLWGIYNLQSFRQRLRFILLHIKSYGLALGIGALMVSLQFCYWKYVGNEWLIYSYQDQGFDWLHPNIVDVVFSYKCGWFIYSPMMIFAVVGLVFLFKNHRNISIPVIAYLLLSLFVTSAWSVWWYGGALGARGLVQYYALWAFPLAAFIQAAFHKKWLAVLLTPILLGFIYLNIWWTKEAHGGHAFYSEQMTGQFFLKAVGRTTYNPEWMKLLDTKHLFEGKENNMQTILTHDFEQDSALVSSTYPLLGLKSGYVDKENQFSPIWKAKSVEAKWYRASCLFAADSKEWETWRMTQFIMQFYAQGKVVSESGVRLHRFIDGGETKDFHFEMLAPNANYDSVGVSFWNAEGDKRMRFDNVQIQAFDEE